jgi:hypothetical protein
MQTKLFSPQRAALVFGSHALRRDGSLSAVPKPPDSLRHHGLWNTDYRRRTRPRDPLTLDDRVFLWRTLCLWLGQASTKPVPITVLGFSDWNHADAQVARYLDNLAAGGDLPGLDDLDKARMLILAELVYGSDLIGAGRQFTADTGIPDETAIDVLRQIQRKIPGYYSGKLLFPDNPQQAHVDRLAAPLVVTGSLSARLTSRNVTSPAAPVHARTETSKPGGLLQLFQLPTAA